MRKANVFVSKKPAGILEELEKGTSYRFSYLQDYKGMPVSLTMPVEQKEFVFTSFPPCFDGVLAEGWQLEGMLKSLKIDYDDSFSQLLAVGKDLVGAVTVEEHE